MGSYGGEPGFASAVLSGTLRRFEGGRGRPFTPTAFDAEMLGVADAAIARGIPLGLFSSLPGTSAPLLLGAAGVVGAILNTRSLAVQVGVVSANLTSRTLYDQLYFREQRLADFVPRTRVDVEGRPQVIGRPNQTTPGRLHLTGELSRILGWIERLDALIIDGTRVDRNELEKVVERCLSRVALIYLTSDPSDSGLSTVRESGGAVWGWDASCLKELYWAAESGGMNGAGPVIVPAETLQLAAGSRITIDCPDNPGELDEALTALWRSLGALSGAYRSLERVGSSWSAAIATRWAWGTFNLVSSLPVAPRTYDAAVGYGPYRLRIDTAPSTARAYGRSVGGEPGQAWYHVADCLDSVLAALAKQEKLASIVRWVDRCVSEQSQGVIATRNSTIAAVMGAALAESPETSPLWAQYIDIATISDVSAGRLRPASDICITGMLPRYRAGLLATPPSPNLTVVTSGPAEAARVAKQALSARRASAEVRHEALTVTAARLGIEPATTLPPPSDFESQVRMAHGNELRSIAPEVLIPGENPWEPFTADVVQILEESAAATSNRQEELSPIPPARPSGAGVQTAVEVIAIYVSGEPGDLVLLLEPNDLVSRRKGRTVTRVAAKALDAGDVLVLVDRAARSDLFDSLTEKLAEHPVYATLQSLIDFWHRRARNAHQSGLSYREILAGMFGTSITSETAIGTWVRGEVDGPQDHEDVRRFARAVRDDELLMKAQEVSIALTTLHRIHRLAGIWLSAQMAGAAVGDRDVLVDPELNIHVADLMESVTSHEITRVDRTLRTVSASAVGVLINEADLIRVRTGVLDDR